jgi:ParB family chromosome partitioning protein
MAKRRRLEAPDTAELANLEAGFAAKPVPDRMGISAPIAQVAGEIARGSVPLAPEARASMAGTSAAAESWRAAEAEGRVLRDLALDAIETDHLVRDRMVMEPVELEELKASIRASGMRLPVEVIALDAGRYGLISGLRRVTVLRQLHAEDPGRWPTVRALIRPAAEAGDTYAAMVEENEQRAQLTPYERGRIAVVATAQGAFGSVEAAVEAIFAPASKAKRSKIRSFALVHEELGDLLAFPTALSERNGLRLAGALRQGQSAALRQTLSAAEPASAEAEWAVVEPAVRQAEMAGRPAERGGRPKSRPEPAGEPLAEGLLLECVRHGDGFSLRLRGTAADSVLMDRLAEELRKLLG